MGNFGNKWNKFVQIFIEKNGYVKVVQGLQNTLLIAVVGMIIGVLIGTIIATVRVLPKYKTLPRALNAVCSFYVGLFRGTPMVVQLLIFYYVMLPLMGIKLPGVRVAMVVFGLNSGAYISEIMRSGIQSVDPGQLEAGRAVGLGFGPAMIRIVIPQAVKNILPALGNEFVVMVKETSLASVFFVGELMTSYKNKEGLFEPDAITLRIGDATDPFDNGAGNEAKIVKTDSGKEYTISKEDARNCTVSAGELKRKVAVAATPAQ